MKPKIIKTKRDYRAALARIKELMEESAPDKDELELWSVLVEKYEEEHSPIDAPARSQPDSHG